MACGQSPNETLSGKRSDLRYFDPSALAQLRFDEFQCQRIASPWLLAGQRKRNNRSRAIIENRLAQDQHRTSSRLFVTDCRIKICPIDVASQYAGHSARSVEIPISAKACSSDGSSFSHSLSKASLSRLVNCSDTAIWNNSERLRKRFARTSESTRPSSAGSIEIAILDAFIPGEYRAPLLGQEFSVFCVFVGLPGKRIESLPGVQDKEVGLDTRGLS